MYNIPMDELIKDDNRGKIIFSCYGINDLDLDNSKLVAARTLKDVLMAKITQEDITPEDVKNNPVLYTVFETYIPTEFPEEIESTESPHEKYVWIIRNGVPIATHFVEITEYEYDYNPDNGVKTVTVLEYDNISKI